MNKLCTHRPSEGEGQQQLPSFRVGEGEGVPAEDDARGVPEGAGPRAGHVALVLLEAKPEEGVAGGGTARSDGGARATPATLAVRELTPRIRHLQHLELEETRTVRALKQEHGKEQGSLQKC